ncbi:MAG: energy-coupling factor transporter transmembrane component T family protein [Candidatus Asgardarchaeia archaeon]
MSIVLAYEPKDSIIHRLDPRTKMIIIAFSLIPPIVFNFPFLSFLCFLISILLAAAGKITKKYLSTLFKTAGWILLLLFIVQGLFNPVGKTPLLQIGPWLTFKREGAIHALSLITRLLAIFGMMFILTMTTHPADLMQSVYNLGVPYKVVYALFSTLNILPMLMVRYEKIKEAQISRGLRTGGNVINRFKAIIPILVPLLLGSIIEAQERAMALEARGFSAPVKKTFLRDIGIKKLDKIVIFIMVLVYGTLTILPFLYPQFFNYLPF